MTFALFSLRFSSRCSAALKGNTATIYVSEGYAYWSEIILPLTNGWIVCSSSSATARVELAVFHPLSWLCIRLPTPDKIAALTASTKGLFVALLYLSAEIHGKLGSMPNHASDTH